MENTPIDIKLRAYLGEFFYQNQKKFQILNQLSKNDRMGRNPPSQATVSVKGVDGSNPTVYAI